MEYRCLGKHGPIVSALGLGCRSFGKSGVTPEACQSVVRKALDLGINFFDTADVYGDGRSEEYLARALADVPRDSYVIATKGGTERLGPRAERQNARPEFLRRSLENSLSRLKTDYVDVYQLHNPDPEVPLEVAAEAFNRFIEEGKIRCVGISNMDREEIDEWLRFVPRTVSVQLPYSLLDTSRVNSVFPPGHNLPISLIPWAPLFIGFVTNPPVVDPNSRTGVLGMLPADFVERGLEACALLKEMAADYGTTESALALAFVLARPEVAVVPVGTTNPSHLEEDAECLEVRIAEGDLSKLKEAAAKVPPPTIPVSFEVTELLAGGRIAVLPLGLKIRVPKGTRVGDRITVNLWDGKVMD